MIFIEPDGTQYYFPKNFVTFKDVLLIPQYSEIESRRNPKLSLKTNMRKFSLNIPILSANMDTVTGFETANVMNNLGGLGPLHRFWKSDDDYLNVIKQCREKNHNQICFSVGLNTTKEFIDKALSIIDDESRTIILVDVAHGHMKLVLNLVTNLRKWYPGVCIVAGNIATVDGFDALIRAGADIVKGGVGPGCFVSNTMIKTNQGYKPIQDIKIGDMVLTHNQIYKEVSELFVKKSDEIISIQYNGKEIKCTSNHEIYVIHENDVKYVTEQNYYDYAKWICASELTNEYYVIEI